MYKALMRFIDDHDNGYVYQGGDSYPRSGYEPDEKRNAYLAGDTNRLGKPVIKEVRQAKKKTEPKADKE